MILTFRPIKVWPENWDRSDDYRTYSPFNSTYQATLRLLDNELAHLGASNVTLQVDASERDCRMDGQLRADAKVKHPGVILTFDSKAHGTLSYSCDEFLTRGYYGHKTASWQENLRAIALGLEALRKVERYGIASRGQQYAGYRELGSGIPMGAVKMTKDEAARLLADAAGLVVDPKGIAALLADPAMVTEVYRNVVKEHHPDVGGDPAVFRRLTEARDLLVGP
jgi:hypothetical protein